MPEQRNRISTLMVFPQGILDATHCDQVQVDSALPHLRQLCSKFNVFSTYLRSHAPSDITSPLNLRPSTIWTAFDHDSPQQTLSQEKIGSRLFQILATAGFQYYQEAVLAKSDVEKFMAFMEPLTKKTRSPLSANDDLNIKLTLLANCVTKANQAINDNRRNLIINKLYLRPIQYQASNPFIYDI
ncbi:uncharacterized protein BX664DRAFT_351255 [Halteromyces radiatus]|uniref:uncharacterized protein n=1 Tax=Halteromyces radiatus TaxID=101107 RepID=UPI00222069CE|nr:uncharacterized protein BX664DRAFT_351255 [Halteromyces radiatus]KAI8084451.1 hypothetical protein BX664DRAFT_351255 [Halteromyces radiatus]